MPQAWVWGAGGSPSSRLQEGTARNGSAAADTPAPRREQQDQGILSLRGGATAGEAAAWG